MTPHAAKLQTIEKLVAKMDLPSYKKTVQSKHDIRWLKNNLGVKNLTHPNYAQAMALLEEVS